MLIFYKAYKTTLQELFLYITTTTALEEAAFSLAIEHQFYYVGQGSICAFLGFLLEYTVSIMKFLFFFFFLYVVYSNLRGNPLKSKNVAKRRWLFILFEVMCILFSVMFPLTYLYVPFLHRTYNLVGGWCWIITIDGKCKNVGLVHQIIFGYGIFEGVGLLSVFLTSVFSIIYCRLVYYVHKIVRHQHLITLRQTLCLLGFLVATVIALSLGFTVRIYTGIVQVEENYALCLTLAIASPIYPAVYSMGFLVYPLKVQERWDQESIVRMETDLQLFISLGV